MPRASLLALAADLVGEDMRPGAQRPPRRSPRVVGAELGPGDVMPARTAAGHDVAVYATEAGEVFVVPDACPHDGGPLSSGFIEDGKLVCARHGWEFDAQTGHCPRRGSSLCPKRLK